MNTIHILERYLKLDKNFLPVHLNIHQHVHLNHHNKKLHNSFKYLEVEKKLYLSQNNHNNHNFIVLVHYHIKIINMKNLQVILLLLIFWNKHIVMV